MAEAEEFVRGVIADAFLDGDVIDDGLGGVAVSLDVAIETTFRLLQRAELLAQFDGSQEGRTDGQ